MTGLLIAAGVFVLIAFFLIIIYNRMVALRQRRENAFADIDVQLKQRADLVPNLVETVKGYATHENEVFTRITEARAKVQQARGLEERANAEGMLGMALTNLFAVAENYPDLKANTNFQHLQAELSDIENKLASARRFFNNATMEYNTAREQFPAVLVANAFGFTKAVFFDLGEEQRARLDEGVKVSFS